ncbi:MAG: hypothetical protein ACK41D_00285 [Rubricoccaceae bacterium]
MNFIPDPTHAAALTATTEALQQGVENVPLARALGRIADWKLQIEATGREDLAPIAQGLGQLQDALTGEGLDAQRIGQLLADLGTQTAAAEAGDDEVRNRLERLGNLLRHAGHALAGNAAEQAP